uniref:Uncharacterized protein n=1 Tax=Setaria digitata TaxID=48799 RepID=A0A915PY14_9BILA
MRSEETANTSTTVKHRHRYKFSKELGKYVRIKKPDTEQEQAANASSRTDSLIISPASKVSPTDGAAEILPTWNIPAFHGPISSATTIEATLSVPHADINKVTFLISSTMTSESTISFHHKLVQKEQNQLLSMLTTTKSLASSSEPLQTMLPPTSASLLTLETLLSPSLSSLELPQLSSLPVSKSRSSLLTTSVPFTSSAPIMKVQLPITRKNPGFMKSHKFLELLEVQRGLQSQISRTSSSLSSSSTKILSSPRLTVSETISQIYSQKNRHQKILDGPEPADSFRQSTSVPSKIGSSSFTLVTALLDIGRGDWWEYRRPLESYYGFLENLLKLKVNLVIFVDQKSVQHVHIRRKLYRLEHITKVIPITLAELPLYRWLNAASEIITAEQSGKHWEPEWDRTMITHPEAKSAEYDILVNSKPYFLYNASIINPFSSEHFVWLDAGYAHGNQSVFPPSFHWSPTLITPSYDSIFRYTLVDLYRKNWAVVSGGFLGGDIHSLKLFHRLYHHVVVDMIHQRYIDDDQTTLVLLIQQHPSLFNVVHGDWFDAFCLFP